MILNRPARKIPQIDRLNFVADHFDELREMYHVIMEHLKVCTGSIESAPVVEGECLWEDDKTRTFIPYFITFNDLPKSVCDLAYATFNAGGHEIPLYWVSDTTYAIPIPYTTYVYDYEEYYIFKILKDQGFQVDRIPDTLQFNNNEYRFKCLISWR